MTSDWLSRHGGVGEVKRGGRVSTRVERKESTPEVKMGVWVEGNGIRGGLMEEEDAACLSTTVLEWVSMKKSDSVPSLFEECHSPII